MLAASARGDAATVGTMLAEGFDDLSLGSEELETPCEQAALNGHVDVLRLLLPPAKRRVALAFAGKGTEGPHAAAEATHTFWHKVLCAAVRGGHCDTVAFVLDTSDVNLMTAKGLQHHEPPLFQAIKFDKMNVAMMLMERGADANAKDEVGQSLLHAAITYDAVQCWDFVLRHCDKDAVDRQGNTPLHYAIECGHAKFAMSLVRAGADINAVNERRITPLHLAASTGRVDLLKMLLVDGHADANLKDYNGKTPLYDAVALDTAAAEEEEESVGGKKMDSEGRQQHMAELLLCNGADPNMQEDVARETPLHVAVRQGLEKTTGMLLTNGADPNTPNKFGVTPAHVAAAFDASHELWMTLLKHGAETDLLDADGRTPLDLVEKPEARKSLQTLLTNYQKP